MRDCGPCALCCILPELPKWNKPGHTPCEHLSDDRDEKRCNAYATRFPPCRKYSCLWLQGEFEEEDRPDLIGAVCSRLDIHHVREIIILELANDEDMPHEFVSRIVDAGSVIHLHKVDGSTSYLGKQDVLDEFFEDVRIVGGA